MRSYLRLTFLGLALVCATAAVPASAEEPPAAGSLTPQEQLSQTRAQVEDMAARLQKQGGSSQEWSMLARSWLMFEEYAKAKDAAQRVIAMEPGKTEPLMLLAEAQMAAAPHGKKLPDDFVATMRKVLAVDAHNVNALYYVGLAEERAGHADKARGLWTDLLARLPADDPARADVNRRLAALGK